MRRIAATLVCVGATVVVAGCNVGEDSARPNLSGTWVLDPTRSSLEITAPDSSIFIIAHVEPTLTVERTHVLDGVADTVQTRIAADSVLVLVQAGGLEIPTRVYWVGDTLVLSQEWSQGDVPISNHVRYTLGDEGQTLIADEYMRAGTDDHHNAWVFRKR